MFEASISISYVQIAYCLVSSQYLILYLSHIFHFHDIIWSKRMSAEIFDRSSVGKKSVANLVPKTSSLRESIPDQQCPKVCLFSFYRNKHRLGKLPHCSALQIIFSGTVVYSGAEIFGHRGAMFGRIIESDFVSGNPSRAALIHSLLVIVDDAWSSIADGWRRGEMWLYDNLHYVGRLSLASSVER